VWNSESNGPLDGCAPAMADTLQEIIQRLADSDLGSTIYAVYPWQPSSNAVVARPRDDGRIPDAAVAAGCRYFLEVHVALQLLHQFKYGQELTEAEQCARVIEYAEFVGSGVKPYGFLKFKFPVNMIIYCGGCRNLFDIVVMSEGSNEYPCPACGKVQVFDLHAFAEKAIEGSRKIFRKPRGGW
jgi:hypothetical protein